jgi:hypothetical protein
LIRSKKFQGLSDQQILDRYLDNPKGEALYFLNLEIEQRGLEERAANQARQQQKSRHSVMYYLFYLFLFAMFLGRFGKDFF